MAYEEMTELRRAARAPATRRKRWCRAGLALLIAPTRRHGRPRHLPGGALRVRRYACRVCGRSKSISSTARPAASASPGFPTGYSRPCPRSAPSTCPGKRLRIARHDLRGRAGACRSACPSGAIRGSTALPELRRVPREHRARHAAVEAAASCSGCRPTPSTSWASRSSSSSCAKDARFSAEYVVPEVRRLLKENHKLHPEAERRPGSHRPLRGVSGRRSPSCARD